MECRRCSGCCGHVAIEIDRPSSKEDHNNIVWYLLHENVTVFIEEKGWFVEFRAKCRELKGNKCDFYRDRPKICRDYDAEGCVRNGCGSDGTVEFRSAKEFLSYMKKKGIDYRYKSWRR